MVVLVCISTCRLSKYCNTEGECAAGGRGNHMTVRKKGGQNSSLFVILPEAKKCFNFEKCTKINSLAVIQFQLKKKISGLGFRGGLRPPHIFRGGGSCPGAPPYSTPMVKSISYVKLNRTPRAWAYTSYSE
jgi:hypothetical protein